MCCLYEMVCQFFNHEQNIKAWKLIYISLIHVLCIILL